MKRLWCGFCVPVVDRSRFVRVLLAITAAICVCAIESRVVGKDSKDKQWKPLVGPWYNWTDSTGEKWDALDIADYQGKEKVTFLSRRAPEETTEHFRAVYFSERKRLLPLPYNVGGKQEIDVYWYGVVDGEGPFFRLADRWGEYLVDVGQGSTALMSRGKGLTFVGELLPGDDMTNVCWSGSGNRIEVSVSGKTAMVVVGPLANEMGKKVGQIRGR